MPKNKIKSFEEFLEAIKMDSDNILYRGVPNVAHQLIPKIGRQKVLSEDIVLHCEEQVFSEFKRRAPAFLSHVPRRDWEWLFSVSIMGFRPDCLIGLQIPSSPSTLPHLPIGVLIALCILSYQYRAWYHLMQQVDASFPDFSAMY